MLKYDQEPLLESELANWLKCDKTTIRRSSRKPERVG